VSSPCQNGEFAERAGQHRQPHPDAVEDRDALVVVHDRDVHVAAAGEHLPGGEAEGVQHPGVAVALGRDGRDRYRGGGQRGDVRAGRRGRGLCPGAPEPQFGVDLGEGAADGGAELQLLGLELWHQVRRGLLVGLIAVPLGPVVLLGVLPLAPPGGDLQGVRTEWDRTASGVDHEQFFLDPDRSHVPMVASSPRWRWLDPPAPPHRGNGTITPLSPTWISVLAGTSGPRSSWSPCDHAHRSCDC
jgi:hypothetical protein